MKTLKIIGIVVLIFLAFMVYRGIKNRQIRKLTAANTEFELKLNFTEKEKAVLKAELKVSNTNLTQLEAEKTALNQKLKESLSEMSYQIEALKKAISEANSLQPDTIYLTLFSKWPHFNQVLKFRFSESQIRGIYLTSLERDNYENLYIRTTKSLVTCTDLNTNNDKIILNLKGQNQNLKATNDLSELEIVNLQDNLKLTDKTLNKQKRKTFFYQVTTVAGLTGLIIFGLK